MTQLTGGPTREHWSGVWHTEVGHWCIAMGAVEGIYMPPGFERAFEVLEPQTKTYMICE